ncbi:hypothetical protein BAE44_0012600 [Dichanthelium oligosanthes]|uniref:ATP-grasp domain-containing protein n=1 Tax=Dichanthelium oligosanthes TaxID=888268 RepID=A0A1E5VMT0_9POAL|nr:hypothetical protein BAE44_0012600 [Dichanthelium oligosanthes]
MPLPRPQALLLPRLSSPYCLLRSLAPPRRVLVSSPPPPPPPPIGGGLALAAPLRAVVSAEQCEAGMGTGEQGRPLRVGLVCGGPSAERGISLNSARSVLDHIQGEDLVVSCYYIDSGMNAFAISPAQLYSNTPSDFDFKLESLAQGFHSLSDFAEHLATNVDIVFPVIHGKFGEDGGIQELLEKANVPFVGTSSKECQRAFDKVKPTRAGSSIGVVVAYGANDAAQKAEEIISEGIDDKVIIEVFLEGGTEFTAIVVDVGTANNSEPVVLLPTEVELQHSSTSDTKEDTIFNYRRKYLPTRQVVYHTPPRFPAEVIDCIRQGIYLLFRCLGLRDFARIDGWFLPSPVASLPSAENSGKFGNTKYGTVLFTDINLISGMEQTSFLFQQASAKVFVIFGGDTSERQVSLMSGTNVWLNLQGFDDLDVTPCLLAPANGCFSSHDQDFSDISREVWTLPYSLVLRHTTEEVHAACVEATEPERVEITARLREQWINLVKEAGAVVFIAVHGGIGEDGTIQTLLESAGVPYTGPGPIASRTCMNKVATSLAVDHLIGYGVRTIPKDVRSTEEVLKSSLVDIWNELKAELQTETVCVKPARDGCSTGVARLCCQKDLEVYTNALRRKFQRLPANCLSRAHGVIEMPVPPPESLIFEPFIETDEIIISNKLENGSARHLVWKGENEWFEITVGVVGKRGEMHSLNPSITVKESGDILSLEEKFQEGFAIDSVVLRYFVQMIGGMKMSGTGINLTPPPATIMSEDALQRCKKSIEIMANTLGAADRSEYRTWDDSIHRADSPSLDRSELAASTKLEDSSSSSARAAGEIGIDPAAGAETEEQRNKFLVLRLYEALNARDHAAVQSLLAPDLEWWFHGPPKHQHMMRVLTGGGGSSNTSTTSGSSFRFVPRSVDAFGSTVIAEGPPAQAAAAGVYWVHAWTVGPDGVITQLREYFNTDLTVTRLAALASAKCIWQSRRPDSATNSLPGLVLAL